MESRNCSDFCYLKQGLLAYDSSGFPSFGPLALHVGSFHCCKAAAELGSPHLGLLAGLCWVLYKCHHRLSLPLPITEWDLTMLTPRCESEFCLVSMSTHGPFTLLFFRPWLLATQATEQATSVTLITQMEMEDV